MYEWSSVVVSSFGWWSHRVEALDSNGTRLIQTFTLQTLIVDLPSSDIHVITSSLTFYVLYSPCWNISRWYTIYSFSGNQQKWFARDLIAHQKGTLTAEVKQWREHDSPESVTERPAPRQHTSPPAELLEHSTTVQDLSMSSRTRRDVGPAGVCCTSGCTMSELIQYCWGRISALKYFWSCMWYIQLCFIKHCI